MGVCVESCGKQWGERIGALLGGKTQLQWQLQGRKEGAAPGYSCPQPAEPKEGAPRQWAQVFPASLSPGGISNLGEFWSPSSFSAECQYFHVSLFLGLFKFFFHTSSQSDPLKVQSFPSFVREELLLSQSPSKGTRKQADTSRELDGDCEWASISFNEAQGNCLTPFFLSWDRNFHLG